MWDLAALPSHGPAHVFVREDDLHNTYQSQTGAQLLHPLISPAACRKADAAELTLFNLTADVRDSMARNLDWNYEGDARVGHVVFLLAMTRNTLTNGVEAYGGMVYCHPFQRRYPFREAWDRLVSMVGKGEPLGPEPPAMVVAVGVPRHPEWTCPAYLRDTFVTWGGQPREAIGPIHELIGYPLLNVGVIRETAVWNSCMLLPRNFNNGHVGLVARIPDGAMTTLRVAACLFLLGTPDNSTPNIERAIDPRVAKDSPPEVDFISYSPTLCPPIMTAGENSQPVNVPFEEQMMAGADYPRQLTFMPIQMMGLSAMTAIVAKAEARLEKVVLNIKSKAAERVRKLAQRSSEVLFTTLKETVKKLEKATDAACDSVEAAEKRTNELLARAGETSTAAASDPAAPADDPPADEPQTAATESRSAKKKKASKDKDKPRPKSNPVVTAIFEAMDAAKGSGVLAQGEAHALLCKREELSTSLCKQFNDALTAFRSEWSEEVVTEDQTLQAAKAAFRSSIRQSFQDSHLEGITPTSVLIHSLCLTLATQVENQAQDRVDAAQDQAERLLDLIQHMFLEALPSLAFLKSSDVGTLDVTLRAFLALLQWVRELGALSFPMGSGTTSATRSRTGELLLPNEVVNAAVGRYMTPEATSTALVEALRERLPSDPSTAGIVRTELISFLQPLTRELAAQASEGAQRVHAVACMRDLPTEDWVQIFKNLIGKGLATESTLPAFLSKIINSNKDAWANILSEAAAGAPEPVADTALEVVKATIPAVLQSQLGMQSLCAALSNTEHHEQVSTALRTFVGDFADDFLRNSLSRPGGSEPIRKLIEEDVVKSVNKYVLDIAESTKAQAERRVVEGAKAWRDKFRKEIKDEIVAELGIAPGGGVALTEDAENRIGDLEKELAEEGSAWKVELTESILTQVKEIMRLRSPGSVGIPGLSPLTTPLAPPRQPPAGGFAGLSSLGPGTKRSGHSPGEGSTPLRKKSREDDVIELDDDGEVPLKRPTPVPPMPVPGKVSTDSRRGSARGATPRGNPPAPRRNPPRVSATERELAIKSEPPLGDDAPVDDAAEYDAPHGGSRGAEESQLEAKGDGEDDGEDDGDDANEAREGDTVGHMWTTRDNWQTRLKSLTKAQLLELDSEKRILKKSGATPSGFESDDALTIAALSWLGDHVPNRKFRLEWASRDEEERDALVGPLGFEGSAAIGFAWLSSVHWTESRDPMILPIEVVREEVYKHGKYSAHLPSLELFTPEHREALDKTMAACTWLTGERQKSKLGLSTDTGRISDKELTREFVTLVYDTPLTKQGFDGFSQISQVLAPFFAPYCPS